LSQLKWFKTSNHHIDERVKGRVDHTSVYYDGKIFSFAGSYKYNMKTMFRETLNQIMIFDL
jgi:hypothetical protein